MSNHSVIEHRANYHFIQVQEDFLAICSHGEKSPHCKALILAILEHWSNIKRDQGEDGYVYMTLPEWLDQTYELYARNVIMACLQDLLDEKLISRRMITRFGHNTFEYKLNIEMIQKQLRALPEKAPKEVKPNLDAYHGWTSAKKEARGKGGEETAVEKSTASSPLKSKRSAVEKSTASSLKINSQQLKSKRNIDTNKDTDKDTSLVVVPCSSSIQQQEEQQLEEPCPSLLHEEAQDHILSRTSEKNTCSAAGEEQQNMRVPARRAQKKQELTDEQKNRARAIRMKIEQRCGKLPTEKAAINENKCIAKLVMDYSDEDIGDVMHYLEHCSFKWSKPDNTYKIRGYVILQEMEPTLRIFRDTPALRTAKSPPRVQEMMPYRGSNMLVMPDDAIRRMATAGGAR
jgi:hypothetical protein